MRYNPPPNWPPPPPGWQPGPNWAPNPAWPPPPPGWHVFLDDEPPVADPPAATPVADPPAVTPVAVPSSLTEIAPEDLSVDHLGARAMATWDAESRFTAGTIVGLSADAHEITVQLSGSDGISFPRARFSDGQPTPRLFVAL